MSRWLKAVVGIVLGVFVVVGVFSVLAGAESSSIWSGPILVEDKGVVTGAQNRGNSLCEYGTMKQRLIPQGSVQRKIDGSLSLDPDREYESEPISTCLVQNSNGLFGLGNNLWSPDSNPDKAIELMPRTISFSPVPSSNILVIKDVGVKGSIISVNYNLPGIGRLNVSSQKEAKIQWDVSGKYSDALRHSDSSPIYSKGGHAFSRNGKFMVVGLSNGQFVRINLRTKIITPFYFHSKTPSSLAISNDGMAALSVVAGNLLLHDLSECENQYWDGQLPRAGASTSGCTNVNLYSKISLLYPEIGNGTISRLRFSPNSASANVDGGWRDSSGSYVWRRFEFKPDNYISKAQGYLAMGDSYSSGEGDLEGGVWYEDGTDEQGDKNTFAGRNLCHLSRRSYPYLMAIELGYLANNTGPPPEDGLFHSVACSGAKMHNIAGGAFGQIDEDADGSTYRFTDNQYRHLSSSSLEDFQPGYRSQINFFSSEFSGEISRPALTPEIVTIGIGGNDAGFGSKLLSCIMPDTCEYASSVDKRSDVIVELSSEKQQLVKTYKAVKQASPESKIFVIGYPNFVQASGGTCANNVHLDDEERYFVSATTRYFNFVIKSAAAEAGVTYVDVENILKGKNLCSGSQEMTVNGVTAGNDNAISPVDSGLFQYGLCMVRNCLGNETYHPNHLAQKLYKQSILTQTSSLTIGNPEPQINKLEIPSDYFGIIAKQHVNGLNGVTPTLQDKIKTTELIKKANSYRNITIESHSLLPGAIVEIEIHSEPMNVATTTANSAGDVELSIQIPQQLEGGYHEIHLKGLDMFGQSVDYYQPILLAQFADDFDGDEIGDLEDSCPIVSNLFIDVDEDGVDDTCDGVITAVMSQDQSLGQEEFNSSEQKAQVLGVATTNSDQEANQEVLGSSLENSGTSIMSFVFIGGGLLLTVFVLARYSKNYKYKLQK